MTGPVEYRLSATRREKVLNRPASPLLHDYKPSANQAQEKSSALRWFAIGLGLPIIGLSLLIAFPNASGTGNNAPVTAPTEELDSTPPGIGVTAPIPFEPIVIPERLAHGIGPTPKYEKTSLTIGRGDTMDKLFRKNNLSVGDLVQIARLPDVAPHMRKLVPGDTFEIEHDGGKVMRLYHELDLTHTLIVNRGDGRFEVETILRPTEKRQSTAHGRIESSLFESAAAAGMSDNLIMNLAGIFAWDVDFVLDIRRGDDYYILYEDVYQDGKFIKNGEILAAEFNNNGRTFQAIRYVDADGRSDYYTADGHSVRKAFIRAPVDFSRISSSFNPRRRHPILNTVRAHQGVDYAAPTGTPIKAAGDGKIIHRGKKGGYGNAVILQHGGNITTLYGHMSSFAKNARLGQRVKQGEIIGFVGKTGLATAPHLHYEYRLNGTHRNPRTVALPDADPIAAKFKESFLSKTQPILAELERYKRSQIEPQQVVATAPKP